MASVAWATFGLMDDAYNYTDHQMEFCSSRDPPP